MAWKFLSQMFPGKELSLCRAAFKGKVAKAERLLMKGVDVNVVCRVEDHPFGEETTPLICAIKGEHLPMVELLVKYCVDINKVAYRGQCSPLHHAVGNVELLQLLIEKGSRVNAEDEDGETPLYIAVSYEDCESAQLLIERGARVNRANAEGQTPLHLASFEGDVHMVQLLINKGAQVNLSEGLSGKTPLHFAVSNESSACAQVLIDHGAKITSVDGEGQTPLHLAAFNKTIDCARLLLEKGADLHSVTHEGQTPLHYAAMIGSLAVAELLVNRGASINATDHEGHTPLYYALEGAEGRQVAEFLNSLRSIKS